MRDRSPRWTLFLILLGKGACMLVAAVAGLSLTHPEPPVAPVLLEGIVLLSLGAALGLGWIGWRQLTGPESGT